MKRGILFLLALALCLGMVPGAWANAELYRDPICTPEEIDLSGVREEGGRLVGEVRLPEGLARGKMRVDCPLPAGFAQEQQQKLRVEYRPIGEKELGKALKALGQEVGEGRLESRQWAGQTFAQFTLEKDIPGYYFWGRLLDASASRDEAWQREYDQAKGVLQSVAGELGVSLHEGLLHTNRRDEEHCYPYSDTAVSDGPQWRERAIGMFRQREEEEGRSERNLTMVNGMFAFYGLPAMYQYRILHGGGSFESGMSALYGAVGDDGSLRHLEVHGVPTLTGAEPMTPPQWTWQELLSRTIANGWCIGNASFEDETYEDGEGNTHTSRASYLLISGIHPCWVGMDGNSLEPGYYMNVEQRVVMDDSLVYPWSSYGDAQTLTCIQ